MTDSQSVSTARDKRRRELLKVAQRLFLAEGYQGTSVSAIVRAAGVAQGTFYLYFKSKEQVLLHLRGGVLADYLRSFETGLAGPGAADERLVNGLERIYGAVRRSRPLVRVIRQAASGEETEQVWLEGKETLARPLAALIEVGVEDGSFQVDDAAMSAYLTLALFDDLLYEALEYGKPASGRRTLRHGSRFLLRALGSDPARVEALVPLPARGR